MNETHEQLKDSFEIGGENLLAPTPTESVQPGATDQSAASQSIPPEKIDDIRLRVGTLLKTENVSLLLGAGASVDCGGQLIGTIPLAVEKDLLKSGITDNQGSSIQPWLEIFYAAVQHSADNAKNPVTHDEIVERRKKLNDDDADKLPANFERVLATLHRWRAALPQAGGQLCLKEVNGHEKLVVNSKDLDECLKHATRALAKTCLLPTADKQKGFFTYKTLIRKLLTRPLNLKRVNIFTLNYDTLVEQACDAEGVVLLDGFVGTLRRMFRPESYEQDLYFPAETTEGRVHRFDRVLHLYKLHGSITWSPTEPTLDNPYGVQTMPFDPEGSEPLLIYPTPAKYGETLGLPYSELFRRFAGALARPQSVLFVIGYGFGDEHVNAIICQALAIPSFTLVIVDPAPKSEFVNTLREQKDRRIWISAGPKFGTFAGFVDGILPDLRDEEIRKKVIATHQALAKKNDTKEDF